MENLILYSFAYEILSHFKTTEDSFFLFLKLFFILLLFRIIYQIFIIILLLDFFISVGKVIRSMFLIFTIHYIFTIFLFRSSIRSFLGHNLIKIEHSVQKIRIESIASHAHNIIENELLQLETHFKSIQIINNIILPCLLPINSLPSKNRYISIHGYFYFGYFVNHAIAAKIKSIKQFSAG